MEVGVSGLDKTLTFEKKLKSSTAFDLLKHTREWLYQQKQHEIM